MKKFIFLLLIPLLFYCKKEVNPPIDNTLRDTTTTQTDTSNNPVPTSKKCYLTKAIKNGSVNEVYERNNEKQILKSSTYISGKLSSYRTYTYQDNELVKIEYYNSTDELAGYHTSAKTGNIITTGLFVKSGSKLLEKNRFIFQLSNDKLMSKKILSLNESTGEHVHISTEYFQYTGNKLDIEYYSISMDKIIEYTIMTFDDKKSSTLNNTSIDPRYSPHNVLEILVKNSYGEEQSKSTYTYTYNENGYPLTEKKLGGSSTVYEYNCN